jgi:hypothetical protein
MAIRMTQKPQSAAFPGFDRSLFQFLEKLAANNNRPWFLENKWRYERDCLAPSLGFIRAFQQHLKKVSPYFVASDRRTGGSLMRVFLGAAGARSAGGAPRGISPARGRVLCGQPLVHAVSLRCPESAVLRLAIDDFHVARGPESATLTHPTAEL